MVLTMRRLYLLVETEICGYLGMTKPGEKEMNPFCSILACSQT